MVKEKKGDRIRPTIIEKFMSFDIWFDPTRGVYYASHCEHTKRAKTIMEIKKWLNKEKR